MRLFFSLTFCCCLLGVSSSADADPPRTQGGCNANMPASTPDSQLTDNHDGTVTDTKTGLMWKKCVEGVDYSSSSDCYYGSAMHFTWKEALEQPGEVNSTGGFATYTDWRLPNIKELRSIVEEQCFDPAINLTHFPNTPSYIFWSGSPYGGNTKCARAVYFGGGSVIGSYLRDQDGKVRLVRGGQ
jgi:hypothetical protein